MGRRKEGSEQDCGAQNTTLALSDSVHATEQGAQMCLGGLTGFPYQAGVQRSAPCVLPWQLRGKSTWGLNLRSQGLEPCSDHLIYDFSNKGFSKAELKFKIHSVLPEWEYRRSPGFRGQAWCKSLMFLLCYPGPCSITRQDTLKLCEALTGKMQYIVWLNCFGPN